MTDFPVLYLKLSIFWTLQVININHLGKAVQPSPKTSCGIPNVATSPEYRSRPTAMRCSLQKILHITGHNSLPYITPLAWLSDRLRADSHRDSHVRPRDLQLFVPGCEQERRAYNATVSVDTPVQTGRTPDQPLLGAWPWVIEWVISGLPWLP